MLNKLKKGRNKIRMNKLFFTFIIILITILLFVGMYFVRGMYSSYKIKQDTTVTDKKGSIIEPSDVEIDNYGE